VLRGGYTPVVTCKKGRIRYKLKNAPFYSTWTVLQKKRILRQKVVVKKKKYAIYSRTIDTTKENNNSFNNHKS